jgi:PKD repeat protein
MQEQLTVSPSAEFSCSVQEGPKPLAVQFTDLTLYQPTTWQWDFGDGNTSSSQNPEHTYEQAGVYTVSLSAGNDHGSDTITKTNYITVTSGPAFLSGWTYRKLVTIAGSPDGVLTDYQMRFTIHRSEGTDSGENVYLGTNVKEDYSDLRFTTITNEMLPYWIESSSASSAVVWVKVPSIPVTGTQMYVYYGNAGAAAVSNGGSTFAFFDDFTRTNLGTDWTAVTGSTVSVSNSVMTLTGRTNADSTIYSSKKFGQNYAVRAKVKTGHVDSASYREMGGFRSFTGDDHHALTIACHATVKNRHYQNNKAGVSLSQITGGITANSFSVWDIIRNGNTNVVYRMNDANQVAIATNIPTMDLGPSFTAGTSTSAKVYVDWVLVRKCTANEPVVIGWE